MVSGLNPGAECCGWRLVRIECHEDCRGSLHVVQGDESVPFRVERIYWISGVKPGETRGGHAHRRQTRLLVAVAGCFTVETEFKGKKASVLLDSPGKGLVVNPGVWTTLTSFSSGTVCLVVSSGKYDVQDYIRDYDEFLSLP